MHVPRIGDWVLEIGSVRRKGSFHKGLSSGDSRDLRDSRDSRDLKVGIFQGETDYF